MFHIIDFERWDRKEIYETFEGYHAEKFFRILEECCRLFKG